MDGNLSQNTGRIRVGFPHVAQLLRTAVNGGREGERERERDAPHTPEMSGRSQLMAAAIDAQRPSTIAAEAIEAIIGVPLAIIVSLRPIVFLAFNVL